MRPTEREVASVARAARSLRSTPARWRPAPGGGYTPARRWLVALEDGRRVFAKIAADELTASWLRDEHLVYSMLRGAAFMPTYLGWYDDGERPVLLLEDLSEWTWPPPWDRSGVDGVLQALRAIAATPAPDGLPRADDEHLGLRRCWDDVDRDRSAMLRLGLCTEAWLAGALGALRSAAEAAPLGGDALLHFDVRSDNLCIRDGRALLVDWNWTCVGNSLLDVALWLPGLHAEGGPAPEELLGPRTDGLPAIASAFAGYLCSHAGLEPIPTAPRVRQAQLAQARTALPWAARLLGLPPPTV